jgi:hypothetical protein
MIKRIFIAIFIGILFIPIVQMNTNFYISSSVDEKRNLAPKPTIESLKQIDNYSINLVKWFNDNYGLRGLLIKIKTQIDYSIFKLSNKIYVGKNGLVNIFQKRNVHVVK